MKIEFLSNALDGAPLVRLYDFTADEAEQLEAVCRGLADGNIDRCMLDEQPWIKPLGGLVMAFTVDGRDRGFVQQPDGAYAWSLRAGMWDLAAGRIQPFAELQEGFAWLDERDGGSLLLSNDGCW